MWLLPRFFCFVFFPPASFVFDKHSIDPSWPGFLCLLTVKKQASQTHDYCGYFWKTSMYLIFHLLQNSACWRPPPPTLLSSPQQQFTLFTISCDVCGMWRPQHTSKVLMLPSVWILKRCPLTHSLGTQKAPAYVNFLKRGGNLKTFSFSKCSFTLLWVVLWMLNHCFHPLST